MYKEVLYILFFIVRFIKNIKIYNNKELIKYTLSMQYFAPQIYYNKLCKNSEKKICNYTYKEKS